MTALIRGAFICVTLFAATLGCMAKDVIVMQIVPLSGPVGAPGTMFSEGASLYFQHVNSKGGINGQRIRHVVLDDKYDADTSLSRLNQTLAEQGTPAALLTFGTASTLAVVAELDRRKLQIPVFPTGSGSTSLRRPFNRNLFHIRAGYANEFAKLIEILATTAVTSFSVVYQDDAFGQDSATVIQRALGDRRLPAAVAFRHDRARQDISDLVAEVSRPPRRRVRRSSSGLMPTN